MIWQNRYVKINKNIFFIKEKEEKGKEKEYCIKILQ